MASKWARIDRRHGLGQVTSSTSYICVTIDGHGQRQAPRGSQARLTTVPIGGPHRFRSGATLGHVLPPAMPFSERRNSLVKHTPASCVWQT